MRIYKRDDVAIGVWNVVFHRCTVGSRFIDVTSANMDAFHCDLRHDPFALALVLRCLIDQKKQTTILLHCAIVDGGI